VIGLGVLVFLVGLFLVFVGAIAGIFLAGGIISVGAGFDLMIVGAIVAIAGYFL
jgi:hypothetical protein